ncbi:MAG: glycosyltransferase family 2 protein, partial [Acidisphaera sp.]|nr:glycosyltransferase family 2 protein [Acidisphaera sp.]
RRECLDEVGPFREDLWAQGYGEENDFSIRARHRGWRHVAVPPAFVAHIGAQSFGAAREHLIARNLDILERLHPGYHALIAAWQMADPLAAARRRLDLARWRGGRSREGAVALITHDAGGGVERVVRARCAAIRADGLRPIVLRPVMDPAATSASARSTLPGLCSVDDAGGQAFPNLRFAIPAELAELTAVLRADRVRTVELHHTLGHHPALLDIAARLGVEQDVVVHDYAMLCPRISLVGALGRYCGEPTDTAQCDACVAASGAAIEEEIGAAALRARSASVLARSRRIVAPSSDAARRLARYFPDRPADIVPHEDDAAPIAIDPVAPGRQLVCVLGGIGVEKGSNVLLACARDAAERNLPLGFVVVGHTIDDASLFATGAAFVTGPYQEAEAVALVRAQRPTLGFLPSIWPETWCFTLTQLWHAGLHVAVFDIGAPAERVRRTGRGWVLPLGLSPPGVNNALLAARADASEGCAAPRRA